MARYRRAEVAERAGVTPEFVDWLVDLGIVAPEEQDRFSPFDVRRVLLCRSLEDAGVPLDGVAAALRRGALSFSFLDAPSYERISALADATFRQVSDRTGIPLELLMVIREAIGMATPSPDDRLREDELAIVPFVELQVSVRIPKRPGFGGRRCLHGGHPSATASYALIPPGPTSLPSYRRS